MEEIGYAKTLTACETIGYYIPHNQNIDVHLCLNIKLHVLIVILEENNLNTATILVYIKIILGNYNIYSLFRAPTIDEIINCVSLKRNRPALRVYNITLLLTVESVSSINV
jgi:hypothetical protein